MFRKSRGYCDGRIRKGETASEKEKKDGWVGKKIKVEKIMVRRWALDMAASCGLEVESWKRREMCGGEWELDTKRTRSRAQRITTAHRCCHGRD